MTFLRNLGVAACVSGWVLAGPAYAQDASAWPEHEIVFIVPYAAGGPTDILARLVGQKLQEQFGQSVIIENKPGGNGSIGAVAAARAEADGYTIYLGGISTMSVAPALSAELPYDPNADFAPVSLLSRQSVLLMASPDFPAKTLADYIAAAKADPGGVSYATSGNGTSGHMAAELFQLAAGVKLNHIPYKGSSPALNDLMGSQVNSMFGTMLAAVPNVRSGAIKAIAVSGETRSAALPDVPTFAEQGLSDYEPGSWNGIYVPDGTPPDVISKLNAAIAVALESKDLAEKLAVDGSVPAHSTPEALADLMRAEQAKWKVVVENSGATIQ
ncbi:tripartite-type tricarboxylate transporter receptor subunit TctC [Shinella sp. BE166]|uniref:Bug family tripartite tricarboxylate transporter substrate binding protein n=1 Tax=Shinella sp. BE166 TaxID=3373918 RepID=UPI003EB88C7B